LRGGEGVGGEEAAGDEFLGEFDLAGGKGGGGCLGEGAVEKLVVKKLMGDLREAVGRQDGDGEGEAVVGVLVVLGDHGGEALAEFYLGLKAGDTEVLGDVEVIKEHFLEGGLQFRGGAVTSAAEFLQQLLRGGLGIVGLAKPVEDQQELFLHLGGSA
jgi:hypothetical protein